MDLHRTTKLAWRGEASSRRPKRELTTLGGARRLDGRPPGGRGRTHEERTTIGILTGGGDVPGLNVAIKPSRARAGSGIEVLGLRRGWASMLIDPATRRRSRDDGGPDRRHRAHIDARAARSCTRRAPTRATSSPTRCPPGCAPRTSGESDGRSTAPARRAGDRGARPRGPVAIGGDDTLSFAGRLNHEGVSVVAIPKTMDNDVVGTDYCIGFSTAVTRSVDMITNFRSAVGSHERIGVVELFGRHSGGPRSTPPIWPPPTARSSPRRPSTSSAWRDFLPPTAPPTPPTTPS